jgi:exonuclease SbcC
VLVQRIYLRNYRVFEDELDLELPPGLVGIYGPNGAGKSSLLESVLWALWGKARTSKDEIPSAGTRGECIAEVSFEHEGHIYLVRRRIAGASATVQAQAHCDNLAVAEGVRDTAHYLHSVLGMDDAAFRASVFAEQKQLAAFSQQGPAERRKLVLSLLGVTPLDAARDRARSDARDATAQHERLRGLLPDLGEAEQAASDAEVHAAAAELAAQEEEKAAAVAKERAVKARQRLSELQDVQRQYDVLVAGGRSARAALDAATARAEELSKELEALTLAEARLAEVDALAGGLAGAEELAKLLDALSQAAAELAALPDGAEPPEAEESALAAASEALMAAQSNLGSATARRDGAVAELERAKRSFEDSASLSGQEQCPLCGQPLGEAFSQVQAHRSAELKAAKESLQAAEAQLAEAQTAATRRDRELRSLAAEAQKARELRSAWERAQARRQDAEHRLSAALAALSHFDAGLGASLGQSPTANAVAELHAKARARRDELRAAAQEAAQLRGQLRRQPEAEKAFEEANRQVETSQEDVRALRAQLKALGFEPEALTLAEAACAEASDALEEAEKRAGDARVAAAKARSAAEAAAERVASARAQHEKLASLETDAVHLNRTAELLNAFRNSVVATVGPRLATQAAELFAELTDNEYDRLEVDPETYGLRISDAGTCYNLDRFSGSEVDLANLALRVAISEHVRFQSGGAVGLLVLDEVFGPLDEERRVRMLLALERLRARFRQILVVTHSTDIKEQLPSAIEVVKKPGRRATARLIGTGA